MLGFELLNRRLSTLKWAGKMIIQEGSSLLKVNGYIMYKYQRRQSRPSSQDDLKFAPTKHFSPATKPTGRSPDDTLDTEKHKIHCMPNIAGSSWIRAPFQTLCPRAILRPEAELLYSIARTAAMLSSPVQADTDTAEPRALAGPSLGVVLGLGRLLLELGEEPVGLGMELLLPPDEPLPDEPLPASPPLPVVMDDGSRFAGA